VRLGSSGTGVGVLIGRRRRGAGGGDRERFVGRGGVVGNWLPIVRHVWSKCAAGWRGDLRRLG